jgi:hypothetical protein
MPVIISGATSGATTIQATDAVTATITLPSATDTLVGKATTDTLTNKTLTLPVVGTTIGVGGATPSASGAGITFPATQSASTDANTLDDYEEGTWTPTIAGSSTTGTGTYSVQSGTYTKVGNTVRVTANLTWTGHTGVGQITVKGYPFTSAAEISPLSFSYYGTSLSLTGPLFQAYKNASSTDSGTAQTSASGGFTAVGIVAAGTYYVSGVYKVA